MNAIRHRASLSDATVYGLARPGVHDLHLALRRIYGDDGGDVWNEVCRVAQIEPADTDFALDSILHAMRHHVDGAVRLCAESFLIRANSFAHLSKTALLVASIS